MNNLVIPMPMLAYCVIGEIILAFGLILYVDWRDRKDEKMD